MRECLSYPSPNAFSRVIGLTNRPLTKSASTLPIENEKWELHCGVDLERGADVVAEKLKAIEGIEGISHVYFTCREALLIGYREYQELTDRFSAYTAHGSDYQTLKQANVTILVNAVQAVEKLCPNLQFWTLQTGGKAYGVEFVDKGIDYNPPLKETMPRIPEPYASNIFYYAQYDTMKRLSEGKKWKYCEIRPDAIVGFVPQNNAMNIAQALGLFLSMYKSVEGSGAEVPFPGNATAFKELHTDTSQDILARFHIFASFHTDAVAGRAFNIADGDVVTWEQIWPGVCSWFGLKGVGPDQTRSTGAQWVQEHKGQWDAWIKEHGLKGGALEATSWDFMSGIMGFTFDRHYDLSACREVGFNETVPTVKGYTLAFERMKHANIIP